MRLFHHEVEGIWISQIIFSTKLHLQIWLGRGKCFIKQDHMNSLQSKDSPPAKIWRKQSWRLEAKFSTDKLCGIQTYWRNDSSSSSPNLQMTFSLNIFPRLCHFEHLLFLKNRDFTQVYRPQKLVRIYCVFWLEKKITGIYITGIYVFSLCAWKIILFNVKFHLILVVLYLQPCRV
jgi:hypothetical protein